MIINITFFSWCDSHFQGLAKRGESSEQKCNTSVWSEAQTKVKLKILIPDQQDEQQVSFLQSLRRQLNVVKWIG